MLQLNCIINSTTERMQLCLKLFLVYLLTSVLWAAFLYGLLSGPALTARSRLRPALIGRSALRDCRALKDSELEW